MFEFLIGYSLGMTVFFVYYFLKSWDLSMVCEGHEQEARSCQRELKSMELDNHTLHESRRIWREEAWNLKPRRDKLGRYATREE